MILRGTLTAVLAFAAACSSDSSTSPTSATLDLNAAVAQTQLGDLSTFTDARALLGTPGPATPTFDPSQCTYTPIDQSFTCPARTSNGLTYTLKYFLYDVGGASLATVDPIRASKLRAVFDITGSTPVSQSTASAGTIRVNHHSDMTMSGLLTSTRVLAGTSRDADTLTSGSGAMLLTTTFGSTGSTTNLALPNSTTNPYPASGTIVADIVGSTKLDDSFSASSSAHTTLTFNGTSTATLTFTSGTSTRTCAIDLSGKTSPKC